MELVREKREEEDGYTIVLRGQRLTIIGSPAEPIGYPKD